MIDFERLALLVNHGSDVVMVLALPMLVGYVLRYWRGSDWRATRAGRSAMLMMVGTIVLLTMGVLTVFLGLDYPGRAYVRGVGYGFFFWAACSSYFTLAAYQRAEKGTSLDPDRDVFSR